MVTYIKLYFATLLVFFAIDMVWLGLVARTFYARYLGFSDGSNQLAGSDYFLPAVHPWDPGVCGGAGSERRFVADDPGSGSSVWADHLRHLRSHQPGNHQGLAAPGDGGGYDLGHCFEFIG